LLQESSDVARTPRLSLAGELHYVVQRGHNDANIFIDEGDYSTFLDTLGVAAATLGVAVHAYVLMPSQFHLLATPPAADSLGRMMQSLGRRYVADFNRRHRRSGALWVGRFRAGLVEGSQHGAEAIQYLESMPSRAGLVTVDEDWRWSSLAHHLGRRRDPRIAEHASYWALGNTPFERELAHAQNLAHGISETHLVALDSMVRRGGVHGSATFVASTESASGMQLHRRPRGRPPRQHQ
jgi:putative transposase